MFSAESSKNTSLVEPQNNDEYQEHRKANNSDSWKHIDWKAYSRGMGLLTKIYADSASMSFSIIIDNETSEKQLQEVTSLLVDAYSKNVSTRLLHGNDEISLGESKQHFEKAISHWGSPLAYLYSSVMNDEYTNNRYLDIAFRAFDSGFVDNKDHFENTSNVLSLYSKTIEFIYRLNLLSNSI